MGLLIDQMDTVQKKTAGRTGPASLDLLGSCDTYRALLSNPITGIFP